MTLREQHFSNVLRSRGVAVLLSLCAMWLTWQSVASGRVSAPPSPESVVFKVGRDWFAAFPELSCAVNLVCLVAVASMMVMVNKLFNLLRTMSVFFAGFFIVACCCTPVVAGYFGTDSLLAIVVLACMWLMFSIYSERICTRRVCMVFALLTGAATLDYHFLLYLPVFFVALGQMRVLRFKTVLAAVLGIAAPLWIVYGAGLAPWPEMPRFFLTSPRLLLELNGGLPFVAAVGFTLLLGFSMWLLNILRILSFNARDRAYNGLLLLIGVATSLYAVVNFTYLPFYVTLLNACVAFQVGLFFRYTASRRGYIYILLMLASYFGLYFWQTYS